MWFSLIGQPGIFGLSYHTHQTFCMKQLLHTVCMAILLAPGARGQVTQINANQSLQFLSAINNSKTLFVSDRDGTIWVSEGTAASTIQLNPNISTDGNGAVLNGKYIFSGTSIVHGTDLFLTDGTPEGTIVLKDIHPNAGSSSPDDFFPHNGYVYFTAEKTGQGRELWRTNGTTEGTALVKDIMPGSMSSNNAGDYYISGLGNLVLFTAQGDDSGKELWKSDGTEAGTVRVADINPGAPGSEPQSKWPCSNLLLFTAQTAANGREVWRTDGTTEGTFLLKDINPGTAGSTQIEIFPGFSIPLFESFHIFNNKAFFIASDGVNPGNLFVTDGTKANTSLVKTLVASPGFPRVILLNAINLPGKFLFGLSDGVSRSEIWQSDGSAVGTKVFKSFHFTDENSMPILFRNFSEGFVTGNDVLFQGNTFFFSAASNAHGNELWKSDGTPAGTTMVKDIGPGNASGMQDIFSYTYTSTALFFAANNGTHGIELWRSDGTASGTVQVQDIRPGQPDAEPMLMTLNNGKVFFGANDGVMPTQTDLYVVDGAFTPLPANLLNLSVFRTGADVQVNWQTQTEANTLHFTIERSADAIHFTEAGRVLAAGNSTVMRNYGFTDQKIAFPPSAALYYRLVTYDKDGSKNFSKVVPLYGKPGSWDAQLLGNVPGGQVALRLNGLEHQATVRVTDLSGRVLFSRSYEARQWQINLPVNSMPKGIYLVSVAHGGEVKTLRLAH